MPYVVSMLCCECLPGHADQQSRSWEVLPMLGALTGCCPGMMVKGAELRVWERLKEMGIDRQIGNEVGGETISFDPNDNIHLTPSLLPFFPPSFPPSLLSFPFPPPSLTVSFSLLPFLPPFFPSFLPLYCLSPYFNLCSFCYWRNWVLKHSNLL